MDLTYSNASYSARVVYTLNTANDWGSGNSKLGETIYFYNKTANSIDLHLFDYEDFDLNATQNGQSMAITMNAHNVILGQTVGSYFFTNNISSTKSPSHVEAAAVGQTLSRLNSTATTLNDVTAAGQPNVMLPARMNGM